MKLKRNAPGKRLAGLCAFGATNLLMSGGVLQDTPANNEKNLTLRSLLSGAGVTEAWFMAPISKRIVEFQTSLAQEPPIRLGTPDPYVPAK